MTVIPHEPQDSVSLVLFFLDRLWPVNTLTSMKSSKSHKSAPAQSAQALPPPQQTASSSSSPKKRRFEADSDEEQQKSAKHKGKGASFLKPVVLLDLPRRSERPRGAPLTANLDEQAASVPESPGNDDHEIVEVRYNPEDQKILLSTEKIVSSHPIAVSQWLDAALSTANLSDDFLGRPKNVALLLCGADVVEIAKKEDK
ncbi:hypothetical protein DL93DRAFT_1177741 [Clavulina sp. PMI_390]|nr:hypothetical protein DL93DRAFT_1177741 [Clavulina sp. PMI_390]